MILKKINNNLVMMLLIFILIASTIFVENIKVYNIIQIIINVIILFYLFIHIVKKKPVKIIKSKLDIFVILLVISTSIPLLFNTYISFEYTITGILNYITLFWVYILTRESGEKNNKSIQILLNIIITLTILLIIVGLENLTTNKIFTFLNINYIKNGESRLVSLLGNPNAFAGLIVFSYFLSINKAVNNNGIKRIIFSIINTILILGLILTYSKAMFLIFIFTSIIYMISIKNKEKNMYILQNSVLSIIMSVIYVFFFQYFIVKETYMLMIIFSIFWLIFASILNIFNIKITKHLLKIKLKYIIIIISILIIVFGIWVSFELQNSKEFIVFDKDSNTNYNAKKINNIKPNENYTFEFDMNADTDLILNRDSQDIFTINIIQRDNKNVDITNTEEMFGIFSGKKEINIKTTENTSEIKIEFKSKYTYVQKEWIIKELKINGQKQILEYKHLPTKLVEKINDINLKYKTAQERFQFIKDGFKLIFKNPFTGIGENGWQFKYEEVQDYGYVSSVPHSYFIQVWLEYGLIGIIGLVGIIYFIIKYKSPEYKGVKFALLALLLHSVIDSDMQYMYFKLIFFIALGIIAIYNKEIKKDKKTSYISNLFFILVASCIIIVYLNPKLYKKNLIIDDLKEAEIGLNVNSDEYKDLKSKEVETYETLIKYERDDFQKNIYELEKLESYIESKKGNLNKIADEYYESIFQFKNKCAYNTTKIALKSNLINKAINLLEEQNDPKLYTTMSRLSKINIDEFEETNEQLEKAVQSKYKDVKKTTEYNSLMNNMYYASRIYKLYNLGIKVNNETDINLEEYIKDNDTKIENTEDIIIYHTHTTEGYYHDNENENYTLDENYNVLAVGKELASELTEKGFNVIHIQKYHNLQGNDGAYQNSTKSIKDELEKQNREIDLVFDIHRDEYIKNNLEENCIRIDGKEVATLRFIVSTGHEGWEDNLKWAIKIQKKADEIYPNLFKTLYIYDGNYNQQLAKHALLIEVGNNNNTIEEAKNSMIYLSNILDNLIE